LKSDKIIFLDTAVRFGDILDQFGGLDKLDMFGIINYIHKYYVGKKVIFYLPESQIRIRNIIDFSIEIKKCLDGSPNFEYWFRFTFDDGKCRLADDETKISVLLDNKN